MNLLADVDPSQAWTAILSGSVSASGILGAVLWWLFYTHLPSKDKQTKELVDAHSVRCDQLVKDYKECSRDERQTFSTALDKVLTHCTEEFRRIVKEK